MSFMQKMVKKFAKPMLFSWFYVGSPKAPKCLK